jgi:DNA polymerase elongation subunit (family B)
MYQNIYIERGEGFGNDTVHLWDDELGYKAFPYSKFDYAYKADKNGSYISMTGVRLSKVKRFKKDDPHIFESDLPQETRVLTDLYLNDDEPSKGHKVMFFDIEVSMENGIPTIENPNNEITSIAVYDSITQQYTVLVLDKSGIHPSYEKDNVNVVMYDSELNLLYGFLDLYEQIGPTIISGWNSDHFDIPYLYNRLKQQCGPNTAGRLSQIGKIKYSKFRGRYQIAGVSSLDYLTLYKKFTYTQQPNYRLDTIGRLEVGMGKVAYEGSLDELFRNDLATFIEYNLQDVRIIVEMDKKLKLIELVRGICHLGHVSYEDYWFSSKFLEGTIVTYLHRKGIIVTNKPAGGREMMDEREASDEEGFAGAFVKEPVPGLYEWVYSLDLQSLYPSIIMSLNISPETKIGFVTNWNVDKHLNEQIDEYLIRGTNEDEVVRLSRDAFLKYMRLENLMISSNGVLYNGNGMGIIPEVLDRWFAQRVEFKNTMKKYKNEGNMELAEYYDRRQHIQKIFLNSLYGVLGLPIFRFFDIDNALAVTASGQDVIKKSAAFANQLYQNKLDTQEDYCTYIDTDSLYFSASPLMPENGGKDFTIKLARAMEKKLNEYYDVLAQDLFFCKNHRLYIKGESVAETAVWIAKKRYTMNVVYDLESNLDVANKMKVKGLDVVRSSFPPAFRDFMNGMMKDILKKATKEDIDKKVLDFRDSMNGMSYLEVARNTAVKNVSEYATSGKLNDFQKGTPAHVKAAMTYNALLKHFKIDNRYEKITDGAKIKWLYLKQNPWNLEAVAVKGYDDPPEIVDIVNTYIDYKALFENELQKKLEDFYSALKWGNIPTEVNQNASEWFSF